MPGEAELLISADSHVWEPSDLWTRELPAAFRGAAPSYPDFEVGSGLRAHPGGRDPRARLSEMEQDGVSGEVLYPSLAMDQLGLTDAGLQEACLRVYNDWLIEYCACSPSRLYGVAMIPSYNIDHAVAELERCKHAGLRGAMVWQVPPRSLSFASDHYERFWGAAQELEMPVSLHIVTGMPYGPRDLTIKRTPAEKFSMSVNRRLLQAMDVLSDIIASGVLERYPRLKIVLVENEVSWLPFALNQWDKYATRGTVEYPLPMLPSKYFARQVFATFFNDPPLRLLAAGIDWATSNCMWSNDFPHPNSTWPKSREVIARDLDMLTSEQRARVIADNVTELYQLPRLAPVG
jgi:predicted TIM-barrel fold metal-dependent hydrolase